MAKLTLGEFAVKFEGHEQRDVDRFDSTQNSMKEGFEAIIQKLDEVGSQINMQVKDHEVRIRSMERYQWIQMGAAGAIGAILTQAVNLFSGNLHL